MKIYDYKSFKKIPEYDQKALKKLHSELFGIRYTKECLEQLEHKKNPMILVAHGPKDEFAGFKMGYEKSPECFYSWTGGVHETHRGHGFASAMLRKQHELCKEHGYKKVQTKTKNKWRGMLILNIKNGFDIIGTYTDSDGEPKIILEKKL